MASTMPSFVQLSKIKDDTFEVDSLHEYILSLQLGNTFFRVCVIDAGRNRCMLLEDYKLSDIQSIDQLIMVLTTLYEEHTLLQAGFWKSVKISFKNLKFSLVPQSLFSEKHLPDFLRLTCSFTSTEKVYYYYHGFNDSVNVFAVEQQVVEWFKKQYPNKTVDLIHHTSLLIEGVMHHPNTHKGKVVYASVEDEILTVLIKQSDQLEYCNNFNYQHPNDLLYFLLLVFHEFELNPELVPLILMGNIRKNSEAYQKVYKYVRNVQFSEKPLNLKFGYRFDELHDHQYFDLYNTHLC